MLLAFARVCLLGALLLLLSACRSARPDPIEQDLEQSFAVPNTLFAERWADSGALPPEYAAGSSAAGSNAAESNAAESNAASVPAPSTGLDLAADATLLEPSRWEAMPEAEEASGRKQPLLPSVLGNAASAPAEPSEVRSSQSGSAPDAVGGVSVAQPSLGSGDDSSLPLAPQVAALWRIYYDEGAASALPHFLALQQAHPERADLQLGTGLCLLQRDELETAGEHFDRAMQLEPLNPTHGFYRAVVAYQLGQFREALTRFEALDPLLQLQPLGTLHRDQRWLMGRTWLALGERERAEQAFVEAFARGAELPTGQLQPPAFPLEWTRDGLLPGASFAPVGGRTERALGAGLLLETEGSIWQLEGRARLRERLTWNPPGWQDLAPTWDPLSQRLAFLSVDQAGRYALMLQGLDGQRQRLLSEPVAPVRPAFSRDGTLLAYVAFEGNPPQPRPFLLRLSTGDRVSVPWPEGAVAELAFSPLNRLVLSAEDHNGIYRLAEVELGASTGRWLEVFPPQRSEPSQAEAGRGRVPEKFQPVSLPVRRRTKSPLRVREPWDSRSTVLEPPPPPGEERTLESEVRQKQLLTPEARKALVAEALAAQKLEARPVMRMGAASSAEKPVSSSPTPPIEQENDLSMGDVRAPSFSARPESARLAFVRQEGGRRVVYLRDAELRREQRLSPVGLDCFAPAMRPDELEVAFICRGQGQDGLYVHSRLSAQTERVVAEPLALRGLWWKEVR